VDEACQGQRHRVGLNAIGGWGRWWTGPFKFRVNGCGPSMSVRNHSVSAIVCFYLKKNKVTLN
jgi:hypothetical protein